MTRKTAFFEGWSWFKFNNLGLALGTNLKLYTSVAKRLKLKVRKFLGLILTFVEVTGEKIVRGIGLKLDILNVTGYQQLRAGVESGCEVAVHAVVDLFEEDTTHGFIQTDASNAFNSINQTLLLDNVRILCPEIATYINNC